jgi:hypothetical protein
VIEERCHGWEYHNQDNRIKLGFEPNQRGPLGMESTLVVGIPGA